MNDATRPLVPSFERTGTGFEYLQKILAGEYAWVPSATIWDSISVTSSAAAS